MRKSTKFSPEVRQRAVRMVQEHRGEYPSLWAAIESISAKIGCVRKSQMLAFGHTFKSVPSAQVAIAHDLVAASQCARGCQIQFVFSRG